MADYRLVQIEDLEEDEEAYDAGEHEEDLTPVGITSPRDLGFILDAGEEEYDDEEEEEDDDEEDEDEEDYDEGEEEEELIPLARVLSAGSIEDGDYEDEDEDEDYEDDEEEYDEDEDYEEEEVEELIPVETMSPRVSSSISHGTTLQGPVLINEGLLDDSESREGKPSGNQNNAGGNVGKEELNIEGFFCPICFEAWTSSGEHQICCLPCGHLYGLSCIKKWLHQRRSSGKCPLCNNICTLKDVTVIYGSPVCIADEVFQKARIDDVIESFGPESVNAEIFTQAAGTARRGWVRGLGGDRLLGGIDTNPFYGATRDDSLREEIERFKQDVDARFHEFDARIQALKAEIDAWPAQLEAYIQSQMETTWHAMQSWQQQNQVRSSSLSSTPPGSPTLPPFVFSLHPPSFRFPRQLSTPVQPPPRASQYPPAPPPYYPQYPPASPQ